MRGAVGLSLALPLLIAACGAPAPFSSTLVGSPSPPPADISLPLLEADEASDGALLHGELAITDGCLTLVTSEGVRGVVWPSPGTRWNSAAQTIELRGTSVRVGERAELGGGEMSMTPALSASLGWIGPPDSSCLIQPLWFAGAILPAGD